MGDGSKRRLFAAGFDNLVAMLVAVLPAAKLSGVSDVHRGVLAVVLYLAVFLLQEGAFGTTLGKGLFGLRILRADGRAAGWSEAWKRTLLRILEVNPILLGGLPAGLLIAFSKSRQRLGDRVAGTWVVRKEGS